MFARNHSPAIPDRRLLRAIRTHLNLSQVDLASMAKVSLATISKLESGELQNPTLETLNALAKTFNCNTSQLLHTETIHPANFSLIESLRGK